MSSYSCKKNLLVQSPFLCLGDQGVRSVLQGPKRGKSFAGWEEAGSTEKCKEGCAEEVKSDSLQRDATNNFALQKINSKRK